MAFAKKVLRTASLLVMLLVFCQVESQQCSKKGSESSQLGMMLRKHIYKLIRGRVLSFVCVRECVVDVRCQSFNFVISDESCEFNNRTREARPEDYVPNSDRYYFGLYQNRGN